MLTFDIDFHVECDGDRCGYKIDFKIGGCKVLCPPGWEASIDKAFLGFGLAKFDLEGRTVYLCERCARKKRMPVEVINQLAFGPEEKAM